MTVKVELGAVFNLGSYNSARVSVEAEARTYEEAYEEARKWFFRAAHSHVKELTVGLKGQNVIDYLAQNLDVEPT